MNVPDVVSVRCNFCSRQRPRYEVHRIPRDGKVICDNCLDWHLHALQFLGGAMPRGCQECGATFEELQKQPGIATRMFVLPKDGVMQMLCSDCVEPYTAKRGDLYRGTRYGHEQAI